MDLRLTCFLGLLAVSGCASPPTGILPFGKDTYTLATTSQFGLANAKRDALQQANNFCAASGLAMMPVNEAWQINANPLTVTATTTTFDFTFRCLSSDDSDFVRTEYDRPDVVIQNQK